MPSCHKCAHKFEADYKPGFRDTCPSCQSYVHACRNCSFYDPSAHNRCREPTSEHVGDDRGQNYCEQFVFSGRAKGPDKSPDAKNKFTNLFGG